MTHNVLYQIESSSRATAQYVCCLLKSHGLIYPWESSGCSTLSPNTIRISIRTPCASSSADFGENNDLISDYGRLLGEIVITQDASLLGALGLKMEPDKCAGDWGYFVQTLDDEYRRIRPTIPARNFHIRCLSAPGESWSERLLWCGPNQCGTVAATNTSGRGTSTVVLIDLISLLDDALLGRSKAQVPFGGWEDWSVVHDHIHAQRVATTAFIDALLKILVSLVRQAVPAAFPEIAGYYPDGKTAPLIVTGDSDIATAEQLDEYVRTLERNGAKGSILLRDFEPYGHSRIRAAREAGHCFGIHPFAERGSAQEFEADFQRLAATFAKLIGGNIPASRNHRFQWLSRNMALSLERNAHTLFDLNSVAGGGNSWIGSPSGIGFPIPFPPYNNHFDDWPRQLPTVVEDDLFLFSYDHCYHGFAAGDSLPSATVLRFLHDWILVKGLPAVLNLHPEHVTETTRYVLDAVLHWADSNKVWMPSLDEFAAWLVVREESQLGTGMPTAPTDLHCDNAPNPLGLI